MYKLDSLTWSRFSHTHLPVGYVNLRIAAGLVSHSSLFGRLEPPGAFRHGSSPPSVFCITSVIRGCQLPPSVIQPPDGGR